MQQKSLNPDEIISLVGGRKYSCVLENPINNIASLENAKSSDVAFCRDSKLRKVLNQSQAGIVITTEKLASQYTGKASIISHSNPELAFSELIDHFYPEKKTLSGVQQGAYIHPSAVVHQEASIANGVTIAENASIAAGVVIMPGCVIGAEAKIGENTLLHPNVVVYAGVSIGKKCIIQANATIGSDGFGYTKSKKGWRKIQHIGSVVIGDEVEIGANTCIDRGMLGDTKINRGVKLDNLIQIAHNVTVGDNTIMAACSGVAGSTKIGNECMIAGRVSIIGHLTIVSQTIIAVGSFVINSIKEAGMYGGVVGVYPQKKNLKLIAVLNKIAETGRALWKKEET
ncbi:MAG: UDP-3-O-(3-hydroxymyristoyl)glucosamine N-acyltransferase [Pseudomonadota bacterium]|nr:UDP-3-O-(3-hydroxymyristoyl)glucosamine N-acyltransferase [Pseudomonadota bacterium]